MGFGINVWVVDGGNWALAVMADMTTYITFTGASDILPNNSVFTPFMATIGARVKFGGR